MPKRTRSGEPVALALSRQHAGIAAGANNRALSQGRSTGQGRGRGPRVDAGAGAPAQLKLDLFVSEARGGGGGGQGNGTNHRSRPQVTAVVQPPAHRAHGLSSLAAGDLSVRLNLRVTQYGSYVCDVVDARWADEDEDSAVDTEATVQRGRGKRLLLGPPRWRINSRRAGLPLEQRVSWAAGALARPNSSDDGNDGNDDESYNYDNDYDDSDNHHKNKDSYRRRRKRVKGPQPEAPVVERLPLLHMASHYMMDADNTPPLAAGHDVEMEMPETTTAAAAEPLPPLVPLPSPGAEIMVKPNATKLMGSGKGGVWTATVFTPPPGFPAPANFSAFGMHTTLPGMPMAARARTKHKVKRSDANAMQLDGEAGDDKEDDNNTRESKRSPGQKTQYANTLFITTGGHVLGRGGGGGSGNGSSSGGGPAGWAFAYNTDPDGVVSGVMEEEASEDDDDDDGQDLRLNEYERQQQRLQRKQHEGSGGRNTHHSQQQQQQQQQQRQLHRRRRVDVQALLEALTFRDWAAKDHAPVVVDRIVLVTSSYHTMKTATQWLREWAGRHWHTAHNHPVPNRDLWQRLSDALGRCARAGCEVSVWHVPRAELGSTVAEAAVEAAQRAAMTTAVGMTGMAIGRRRGRRIRY